MALPRSLEDRVYKGWEEVDGLPHRLVKGTVTGTLTPTGLQNGGLHTTVSIDDSSWTELPATALADRNAIGIQNYTGFEIKVNFRDDVGYVGMRIPDSNEKYYGITDAISIYARAEPGAGTITIDVEEIS